MVTLAAPDRSLAQRQEAIKLANWTRVRRAVLKRDVKAGRESGVALLLNPPAYIETMKAWDLIFAMPKLGRVKVNKALSQCQISPSKTLGGLSDRQRRALADVLGRRYG